MTSSSQNRTIHSENNHGQKKKNNSDDVMRKSSWREWAGQHLPPYWCWERLDYGRKRKKKKSLLWFLFILILKKKSYLKLNKKKSHNQISASAFLLSLHTLFPTETDEWKQPWNAFFACFFLETQGQEKRNFNVVQNFQVKFFHFWEAQKKSNIAVFHPSSYKISTNASAKR